MPRLVSTVLKKILSQYWEILHKNPNSCNFLKNQKIWLTLIPSRPPRKQLIRPNKIAPFRKSWGKRGVSGQEEEGVKQTNKQSLGHPSCHSLHHSPLSTLRLSISCCCSSDLRDHYISFCALVLCDGLKETKRATCLKRIFLFKQV